MINNINTNEKKIKIAIVGCGRICKNHIKSILYLSARADLVALCDNKNENLIEAKNYLENESEINSINNKSNINLYNNYNELIKDYCNCEIKIDLIILATPSGMHANQAIIAAKAGLNVCTEKPMATKWADGLEMIKAFDNAEKELFVMKQNRFNPTLQLVRKQLKKGRFGKISLVAVNVFWHRPQSYYDQATWRGTWELDGGALMNQASHYIDLLDWLIGPVQSLSASTSTIARQIEAEDTAAIQLRWKNGALGTMAVSMITYPKNLEGSITILGEEGTVKIGGKAVNDIEYWEFKDKSSDDDLIKKASYETTSVYGNGHQAYYENMIDVLEGKDEPMCNGREGLKSLELIVAAYESSKTNQLIHLPIESNL